MNWCGKWRKLHLYVACECGQMSNTKSLSSELGGNSFAMPHLALVVPCDNVTLQN